MTGARASFARPSIAFLFVLLCAMAILATGCGEEDGDVTFPDPLEPVTGQWFLGVWGTGPDDVYVVGQPGLIFHWDGTDWTQQDSHTSEALTDVWGDDAGNVYVTGHGGLVLRLQGDEWTTMDTGTEADLFNIGSFQDNIYACGRNEDFAVLRRLDGGSWSEAPGEIFLRDNELAVTDTFYLHSDDDPEEIIESLATVGYFGIAGADGVILMEDPETDWQLRRILGGEEWVKAAASSDRVSGNFIATSGGRLFHLVEGDGSQLSWEEVYSPALDASIFGLYSDAADTVWAVTDDGRVNRVDPPYGNAVSLYNDGKALFDVWGSSGTNLYAVGIDGRVLHFHEVEGEHQWVEEILPLPDTKKDGTPAFDRFGDPIQ